MNFRVSAILVVALGVSELPAPAELITIEPDNYPNGTTLNLVNPAVSLITVANNNLPHQPSPFSVWATTSFMPFVPPTGTSVFSHVGVPFFNSDRRLRMDFAGLVSTVSIDFQGGAAGSQEQGMLAIYDLNNLLLSSYTTAGLPGGQIETMSLTRPTPDIAYAVAYTITANSPFGRLDHLVFNTPVPVPEPVAVWFLATGSLLLFVLRKTNR